MRKVISSLAAAALAAGLMLAVAAPAGASVPAKTSFCKALKNFDATSLGNPTTEKGASKSLKQLKKLQVAAKGDVKKALTKIVAAYQKVADGESAKDAFANSAFIKAAGTFALAAGKCLVNDLPNITLPDIHLPGQ